jgi:hypothetical protein
MQSVYVIQMCELPSKSPEWKTQLQFGIFRRREDAETTMFNVMARKMRNGIDEIREMTSTKRGKGLQDYNLKVDEITVQIPRSIRVCELPLRDNLVRYS